MSESDDPVKTECNVASPIESDKKLIKTQNQNDKIENSTSPLSKEKVKYKKNIPSTSKVVKDEHPFVTHRRGGKTNKTTTVDENESSNDSDSQTSNKSKELPDQYQSEKYPFCVKIGYEVYFHNKVIKNLHTTIPLLDPDTDIPDIEGIFRTTLKGLTAESEGPLYSNINFNNNEDWSLSTFDMAIPIKEITELVKEYDGDPKKIKYVCEK